jgi:hypothetical protein
MARQKLQSPLIGGKERRMVHLLSEGDIVAATYHELLVSTVSFFSTWIIIHDSFSAKLNQFDRGHGIKHFTLPSQNNS